MGNDLVIFDCDGVLVDSERLTVAVEARVLTELGWPHTAQDVVDRYMGRSSQAMLADVEAVLGPAATRVFDEQAMAEVHEIFERKLTPVPGVQSVLAQLSRQGTATCVASSGTHETMRRTLGLTGLYDDLAGRIFSATEVPRGKPAPDLFLHAAATMGVCPDRTAVVEDSVCGVQAAVSAGMTVYGFGGGLSSAETLMGAGAVVFQEMEELVGLLDHSSANIAWSASSVHLPLSISFLTRCASFRMPRRVSTAAEPTLRTSIRAMIRCMSKKSNPRARMNSAPSVASPRRSKSG